MDCDRFRGFGGVDWAVATVVVISAGEGAKAGHRCGNKKAKDGQRDQAQEDHWFDLVHSPNW